MSFWRSETLGRRLANGPLIDPFDKDQIQYCAYELRLGVEAFLTPRGVKKKYAEDDQINIPPGQFGLLITLETVKVPEDAIAFISIRSKFKQKGLINVSGFHVDPGYSGRLIFSVYNAGSQDVVLDIGSRVFLIWYCSLDEPTEDIRGKHPGENGRTGIRATEVDELAGHVSSPAELRREVDRLKTVLWVLTPLVISLVIAVFGAAVNGWFGSKQTNEMREVRTTNSVAAEVSPAEGKDGIE